jgi:hypothetical protein
MHASLLWTRTKIRCTNYLRKRLFERVHRDHVNYYTYLDSSELRRTKSSETLFVFGSGSSLNEITPEEWQQIAAADTLGFNQFIRQDFLDLRYYLVREIGGIDHSKTAISNRAYDEFREALRSRRLAETVFLLQGDLLADVSIEVQHRFLLPEGCRIWLYRTLSRKTTVLPSASLDDGLVHAGSTLADAVSFGYAMGYSSIVLVGIDLYDRRYFWLRADETRREDLARDASHTDMHNTAKPILSLMKSWAVFLQHRGVSLTVYNRRSLLAEVMNIYPARGV